MSERDQEILRSLADRIDPRDAGAHNNMGVVFFQKGLVQEAIAAFERALELDPRLDVARKNVEVAYVGSGHFQKRVETLRERVRRDVTDAEAMDALARTYLLGGASDQAARVWASLLDRRPNNAALHMKLSFARAEEGRVDDALALAARATELAPNLPAAHLQQAELLQQAGRLEQAETAAHRALELGGGARAYRVLADILEAADRADEAREVRDRAQKLDPTAMGGANHLSLERYQAGGEAREERGNPREAQAFLNHLARATALRQAGDLAGAGEALEKALEVGEDPFEARQALAEVRLLAGEAEAAEALYRELLKEREESPKLWNEWGVCLHRLGRVSESVDAYRHSVALDYTYALAWNNLGVARAQLDERGPSERAMRKAGEDSTTPEILWNLGLFLTLNDQAGEAVEVYTAAVRADRSLAESWNRLGGALFQAERNDEARRALEHALKLDPDLAEARYQLGFALSALGDFRGALRETKRALDRESVFPAPRYLLLVDVQFEAGALPAPDSGVGETVKTGEEIGGFEFEPGSLDEAFAAFGAPEAPDPAEVAAVMEQAETALRRGRMQRAQDRAARAVALLPEAPGPRLLQARIYLQMGLAGEALERYLEVMATGGEEAREAAEGRIRSLLVLERSTEAVQAAEEALGLGVPRALLGQALLQAGDPESASEAFDGAMEEGDRSTLTIQGYAQSLLAAGRPRDAEPLFRRALDGGQSVAALVGLARTLLALGDRSAAEEAFRRAVAILPSYPPAAVGLATLQWRDGRTRDGLRTLVRLLELDSRNLDGLVLLGTWLHETGRSAEAVKPLERALALAPDRPGLRERLDRVREGV